MNKDGSKKTECGIHVSGAEQTFDRDLWEAGVVAQLASQEEALALKSAGKKSVVVVYAPWCQFCQAMEAEYEQLAADLAKDGITVTKYRGDEDREFVTANFNAASFPTINLVSASGEVTKYDSEDRSVAAMKSFVLA